MDQAFPVFVDPQQFDVFGLSVEPASAFLSDPDVHGEKCDILEVFIVLCTRAQDWNTSELKVTAAVFDCNGRPIGSAVKCIDEGQFWGKTLIDFSVFVYGKPESVRVFVSNN